jgi:PAS domain S-box-containing protein
MNISLVPFFENSLDIFCIADFNSYFKKVNPAFVNLLGYTEEELYSKQVKNFIFEEDIPRTLKYGEDLRKNIPITSVENRYITKSGEIVWFHWTLMTVIEEKLIYGIAKDITYKKILEEERVNHLYELDKKSKNLKNLNYKTSHDLRSPLNNLLTLVDILEVEKNKDPQTYEIVSLIKESTYGLKKSLDNYIDRIEDVDNLDLKVEEVNFEEILKKVKFSISALIKDSKTQFICDFSQIENVAFNQCYMESVFLNFITNSIKYANPLNQNPVIYISTKLENGKTKLIYTDNGLGFDMEAVKNKVFKISQKFHYNKDSKGVGLYLINYHVTNLGGEITLESEVNKGSTFTITF